MKITVKLVVDVDPKDWATANGMVEPSAAEVREDVKRYVLNHTQQANMMDETDADVRMG